METYNFYIKADIIEVKSREIKPIPNKIGSINTTASNHFNLNKVVWTN